MAVGSLKRLVILFFKPQKKTYRLIGSPSSICADGISRCHDYKVCCSSALGGYMCCPPGRK